MIALIAVLRNAANISSLIACSELWMISSVIGSTSVSVRTGRHQASASPSGESMTRLPTSSTVDCASRA